MTRPLARFSTALLAVAALTATLAAPVYAEEEPPDGELPPIACPDFPGEPSAADEFEAYRLALACGVNVEVTSLRDIDRQVYATPAGTLDAQMAVEPYQVRDAAGSWVPIDPTLVARPDGSAAAAATVIAIATGAGGGAPFVTATDPDGGALSLRWPLGPLPAPVVSGSVATFPNVLPDIDLAVQAESVGFSWLLVVKTEEAADNPALETIDVGIETVGLTVAEDPESDRIEVLDADGDVVFEAGQGIMWDSSPVGEPAGLAATAVEPAADPGRIADVSVETTATGITLTPDTEMLADPTVSYPLYIDPPFTSTRKAWANVLQSRSGTGWTGDGSWPRSGGMRVGMDTWSTCGSGCGLWRSVITLNIGGLKGKYIASASVNLLQTHMGGCADQNLQLWRTGEISNGTSWNGVDWYYGDPLQSKSVPSSNQTGCSGKDNEWVEFDGANVKKRVQSAADNKNSTISFGVRSSNEDSKDAWRRIKTSSVQLHVTYYLYPPLPDRLKVDGTGCDPTESGSPWVNERYPTFSARARSAESESVYLRFRVRKVAAESNHYWYRTPDPVGSYATVNRKGTTSLPDGSYKWQARTDSRQTEAVNSGYTNYCYFKVDATKPAIPTVTGPTGAVTEGSSVKMTLKSSDPVVNGSSSGLSRFEYSWGSEDYLQKVASTGTASVTLPAAPAGRQVLYVRAVDNAGNESAGQAFTFFVGSDISATVMSAWRLGGDAFDETLHRKHLATPIGDPAFVRDTVDPANTVTEFDGNDCLTGPASIHTDRAFTVSMSVRMDAKNETSPIKVLTQGNTTHSAFQIQYSGAEDKWYFSLPDAPGETFTWKSVGAASPVPLGQWFDIVATYDPDADLSRIYFNGVLAGELNVTFTPWDGVDRFSLGCLQTGTGGGHFFNGAVENVSVWQGLVAPSRIKTGVLMPIGELAHWELRGDGTDASVFKRDVTLPESVQQSFDPFGRPDGAMVLDGRSCATTSVPIVPGDEMFNIGVWLKPTRVTGARQVLFSQVDAEGDGFVAAITADGKWELGSASGAGASSVITPMSTPTDVPPGTGWQYVRFDYNGAGRWQVNVAGYMGSTWNAGIPGWADAPLTIGCGAAGDHFTGLMHDITVQRGDVSGSKFDSTPAELTSWWSLEGGGVDESGNGRALAFSGYYEPADNRSNGPDKAVKFTGAGCAATSGPALDTDESFTVGAWVKLDSLATSQVMVSAAGTKNTGLRLAYNPDRKTFEFTMTSIDEASGSGGVFSVAHGGPVAEVGTWYFVVGTFDLSTKKMRLYVDGAEAGTAQGPASPWNATGPLLVGAAGTTTSRWNYLNGTVDDVVVWQGTVSGRSIANMFGTNEQEA